ncbi:MAG: Asp-tRNA(Asn)/Glu-tRNA(Gln) amidotransferase subunit GatC [Puniceicoccales bacterium]|jgi:aspartyl-tRNA(Asn)/glutamyl-tRNA(Gln) amidotransferase subunit C|nr:Asp-tRNA(Asn)/Glu-tRNA(Gln) amidotransferase subunit GatC [Puniceicoccales bacterium]
MNEKLEGENGGIDIDRVATLARIHLTERERSDFRESLNSILAFLSKLSEIDVNGVEPSAHAMPLYNVLRDDVPGKTFDSETALANAPKQRNNLVIVPKVVE